MRRKGTKGKWIGILTGLAVLCSFPVVEVGAGAPASSSVWGTTRVVDNQALVFWETEPTLGGQETALGEEVGQAAKYRIIDGRIVADQAYYGNRDLTGLILPSTIKEIGMFAFARSGIRQIELPYGLETIGMGAFYHCDSLEGIILPDTVLHVEPKAFDKTLWMEKFLEEAGESFLVEGGVLLAYKGTDRVVEIPEGVRLIGPMVFAGHEEMEKVILPESILSVEEGAFLDCSNLKEVVWNQKVETIRDRAFAGCGLEAVTLPPGIRRMGAFAFDGDCQVTGSGEAIETITETDMAYLSHLSYRPISETDAGKGEGLSSGKANGEAPGRLRVLAPEGMEASLEGLKRDYSLTVEEGAVEERMKKAYLRSMGQEPPASASSYTLQLREDISDVEIRQLDKEGMTLSMSHPGAEVKVYTLDRNGQLERVEAKNEGERLVLQLYHLYGPILVITE